MGYSSLDNIHSSDFASGFHRSLVNTIATAINKEIPEDNRPNNTDGCVNVALAIESGVLDGLTRDDLDDVNLELLLKFLDTGLRECAATTAKEWASDNSRRMHFDGYTRMIASVKKFMEVRKIKH